MENLTKEEILYAILDSKQIVKGVKVPLPQTSGTYRQNRSYAEQKAEEIFSNQPTKKS
jgi:hypothetical protein